MIKLTNSEKTLVIPSGLGFGGQNSGSGGGVTPEEAAQIASAVTAEALDEYDTELQVDLEEIRDAVSGNSEDIATLSATTEEISQQIGSLSGLTDDIAAISGQTSANTQNIGILSGATSALTASVSALTANDNIAFFNLIKDYGNSNEELARLYDDMDAANTAGKTVVAMSNFATGDTTNAAVFCEFRKDMNGGFYGAGSGVHYNGTTYIAARAVPIFRRDDYYNVIKKDGHFYFSDMGTIAPYTLPTASSSTKGGIKVGSGLTMGGEVMSIKAGEGLGFSGDTLVVSGGTGGGKTPIVLEEHYGDPTWTVIYNAVAQSAVTMGVEEFAKNYDIYIKRLDDQENPYSVKQAVGFAIQQGEDWDETAQDWVQTTWVTFNTFESIGNNYWLLSTGSRGLGVIGGFDGNVPHPKSAWINIDASGDVIDDNISEADEGLAQYNDNGTDYAFSMYLCCTTSDAERYRGNLQNYRKNYNNVNGNHFFRFIIDIDGTEYEAEYYWDSANSQLVKIVFQTYKAYLQSILNS